MIDRKIFEITSRYAGAFFTGGASDEAICKYQDELGVQLPDSYIRFLKEFGAGGWGEFYLSGIEKATYSSMMEDTIDYRKSNDLPDAYVVFIHRRGADFEYLLCLDTSRISNGECPVVKYDLLTDAITDYKQTFDDAFNEGVKDVYDTRVVPRLADTHETKELPAGLGYKSCWLTVVGSNRDEILKSMNVKNPVKMDYSEALEMIRSQSRKVMITADFDNRNYILFYGGDFKYDEETVKKIVQGLPEVYGYMTHRVIEAHGFFKALNGEILRLYYQDEERIISIGAPLPEEKTNKIKLPSSFEEYKEKPKKFTRLSEDIILGLADESSSVEINTYPYEQVIVAEL